MRCVCIGPYSDVTTAKLRLSNPGQRRVCFKIKSNVPRQYCVQPSIAVVPPDNHVDVNGIQFILHAAILICVSISSKNF